MWVEQGEASSPALTTVLWMGEGQGQHSHALGTMHVLNSRQCARQKIPNKINLQSTEETGCLCGVILNIKLEPQCIQRRGSSDTLELTHQQIL